MADDQVIGSKDTEKFAETVYVPYFFSFCGDFNLLQCWRLLKIWFKFGFISKTDFEI